MSWQSAMIPGNGPDGKPVISVLAKKTYDILPGKVLPAKEQLELNYKEIASDLEDPSFSELVSESDIIAYKPYTDIIILGKACTPNGKKAYYMDCEVKVGNISKKIMVFGERKIESKRFKGLYFSDPEPFDKIHIGYSNAFGGRSLSNNGTLYSFPPNPLGKGFSLKDSFEDYSEIVVPLLESPDSPIEPEDLIFEKYEDWKDAPKPVSFGWTRQSFFPRFTYAGVVPGLPGAYGSDYQINPALPKLDLRFYQGASEGLCNSVLHGDEHVRLTHFDPEYPVFEFRLPGEKPEITVGENAEKQNLEPALHTVLIDKENDILSVVWRGCKSIENPVEDLARLKGLFSVA